jgi:hypothetical protein
MNNHAGRVSRLSRTLLCAAIAAGLHGGVALGASAASDAHRVVVPSGLYHGNEAGATLLHDYGSFQLYRVDNTRLAELRALARGVVQVQKDIVEFEAAGFDTARQAVADIPAAFRAGKPDGPAVRLVQFAGPIADAWLHEMTAGGVRVVQYVPNNAYLVLADAQQQDALEKLVDHDGVLTYAGTLDPFYKLDRTIAAGVHAGLGG